MIRLENSTRRNEQLGGVTIVVVLMLLVLLTVSGVAMSRNALRESMIMGTIRQGADVRNVADSGLEWSLYWMDERMTNVRPAPDAGATALRTLSLQISNNAEAEGMPHALPTASGSSMIQDPGGTPERRFDLVVTRMGKYSPLNSSINPQGDTPGLSQAALFPDRWSVRANGQLVYPGVTFNHSREVWFTQPPRGAVGSNN